MTNILGPVAGGQVTARPARSNEYGLTWTWYQGCSGPEVEDGTTLDPDVMNDITANLRTALVNAGINLDNADDMLWRAMQAAGIRFGADIGTANTIVVNFDNPVRALTEGLLVSIKIAATNTGAVTFNANGLGAVQVVNRSGGALAADDLVAGQYTLLAYVNAKWQVANLPYIGGGGGGGGAAAGITGQLVLAFGNAALAGTLKCAGQTVSRATYPDLWTYANASGRIVSDADWSNAALKKWTSFSTGDGATTFRLPDLRGEFMRFFDDGRGADTSRVLGEFQDMLIQNHPHDGAVTIDTPEAVGVTPYAPPAPDFPKLVLGADYALGGGTGITLYDAVSIPVGAGTAMIAGVPFNQLVISMASSGGGAETRPRNAALMACIVY